MNTNSQIEKYRPAAIPFRVFLRRFLVISTIILAVFALTGIAVLIAHTELERQEAQVKNGSAVELAASLALHDFETVIADVSFLANDDTILDFLGGKDLEVSVPRIENEFINLSKSRRLYDQIRLIDPAGNEMVRVNFVNGAPIIVPRRKLQNKFNRYYFTETSKLAKGKTYISPIDLNVENGKVEVPYKPMIRFGTPLYDSSGAFRGVIILNYLGKILIDQFKRQMELAPGAGGLINSDGYWLSSSNSNDEWTFMLGGNANFGNQYPDAWSSIKSQNNGSIQTDNGSFIYTTVHPFTDVSRTSSNGLHMKEWKIITISISKPISLTLIFDYLVKYFQLFGILPISLIIGWYSARASAGKKIADQQLALANLSLESEVEIRTTELQAALIQSKQAEQELQKLTHDLGERIKEQTGLYSIAETLSRLNISASNAFLLAVEVLPPAWHYPDITCARISHGKRNFTTKNFKVTEWRQAADITHQGEIVGEIEIFYLEEMPALDEGPFLKEERSLINSIAKSLEIFLDHKHAEEQLIEMKNEAEKANKAKSEFLASMSHELRTPLNAVLGFAQMLQFDPKNPLSPTQNDHVEGILSGGHHLLELVNEILDLARIEGSQIELAIEEVNANEVVEGCVDMTIPLCDPQDITIINQFGNDIDVVLRTDPMRFKQCLINLLSNAVKYNKDGGMVTIGGHETNDNFLHLAVTDTGIGIAEEHHQNLFHMFQRLEADPMKTQEGTGIGLTVSKLLVERMAGRIGFESGEGVGSTFWIELPLAENDEVLIWTDTMRVGVDAIDKDHQTLIQLMNKASYRELDEAQIDKIIDELIDYTDYHFRREEAVMEVCGYPDLDSHRGLHRTLTAQVTDLANTWQAHHEPETLHLLRSFLRSWLIGHILNVDTEVAKYANGKGAEIRKALSPHE